MSASTTLLADAKVLAAGTATTQSQKNATNPAFAGNSYTGYGPSLLDLAGMQAEVLVVVKEYKKLLTILADVLDTGDPLYTTVTNDLLTLV